MLAEQDALPAEFADAMKAAQISSLSTAHSKQELEGKKNKNKKNKDKKEKAVERKMRNARRIHISRLMKRRDSILSLPLKERAYVHVQSRLPEKKIASYSPTRLQRQHEEDLRSVNSVISDIDALLSP